MLNNNSEIKANLDNIDSPIKLTGIIIFAIIVVYGLSIFLVPKITDRLPFYLYLILSILIIVVFFLTIFIVIKNRIPFLNDSELNAFLKNQKNNYIEPSNHQQHDKSSELRLILEMLANRSANESRTTDLFIQIAQGKLPQETLFMFRKYKDDALATYHTAMYLIRKHKYESPEIDKLKRAEVLFEKTSTFDKIVSQFIIQKQKKKND